MNERSYSYNKKQMYYLLQLHNITPQRFFCLLYCTTSQSITDYKYTYILH
jgi:hypothetical protein